MEKVHFLTEDRVRIVGNFWPGVGERAILLLHMMPATKESWTALAERLNAEGFDVLAIDLRGHGESIESRDGGGELDYKLFGDEEHQASRLDVIASGKWLGEKGIEASSMYVGGASIGANLALEYMSEHLECPGGFLLSPGLNYKGIEAVPLAGRLAPTQRIFIAAAEDDERSGGGAAKQATQIYEAASSEKIIKTFREGGHGADMLDFHKELFEELVSWLLADLRE